MHSVISNNYNSLTILIFPSDPYNEISKRRKRLILTSIHVASPRSGEDSGELTGGGSG